MTPTRRKPDPFLEVGETNTKPWLSREVSVQWIVGLILAFGAWSYNERGRTAAEMAQIKAGLDQRPDLVERRNRAEDKLQACLERQIDMAMGCKG